jgi:hypothetical protein
MWARVFAVALVFGTSSVALADGGTAGAVQRAAEHFDEGSRAYQAKRFEEAASHFEAAFAAVPNARVLRLAIRGRESAGQGDRAATLSALALARFSEDLDTVKLAKEVLSKFSGNLVRVTVRCTAPCLLAVDERAVVGGIEAQHTLYLTPGSASLRASFASGGEVSRAIVGKAGEALGVELSPPEDEEEAAAALVAKPGRPDQKTTQPRETEAKSEAVATSSAVAAPASAPPTKAEPRSEAVWIEPTPPKVESDAPWYRGRGLFFTALGVTAVAGGVTAWSGYDTLTNPGVDAVRTACVGQGLDCPEYQLGLQKQLRTNVLIGATGGAGLATLLIGTLLTEFSPATATHATGWLSPGEGGVLVRGDF